MTEQRGGIKTPYSSNIKDEVAFHTDGVDSRVSKDSKYVNTTYDILMRSHYTNNCPNKKAFVTDSRNSKTLTNKETPTSGTGTIGDKT